MSDQRRRTSCISLEAADGQVRARNFDVRDIPLSEAQRMVAEWHYAGGGSNTGTYVHGLIHKPTDEMVGTAWWIPPTKTAAVANLRGTQFEGTDMWKRVLTLSRLVIHPDLNGGTNAASMLIGRSIRLIQQDLHEDGLPRFPVLLTYADEWQGHGGTIYKATGWEYRGRTNKEATWVDPNRDDMFVARKAGGKTRTKGEMEELGYKMIGRFSKARYRKVLV